MIRIGKAGYVEVPSRLWETCRGLERGIAGLSHHRWLIEIDAAANSPEKAVQWLFWTGSFEFREDLIYGEEEQLREMEISCNGNALIRNSCWIPKPN